MKFQILANFCKFCDICNFLPKFHENCCFFKPIFCENFEIAAVQKHAHLVELDKCCQTHIFLQNFVLIQPSTSPPKFIKIQQKENVNFASKCDSVWAVLAIAREEGPREHVLVFCNGLSAKFQQNLARFRLHRHRSLQVNTSFSAFFKIYQIVKLQFLKIGKIL